MNAREIVDLLLEADQTSAGDPTGVYIFGPNLPKEGYSTPSVETAINEFRKFGIISPDVRDKPGLVDELVRMGYTFFLKKAPGDIEVIGRVPAKTTPDGQERASQYLGLEKHDRVAYRRTPTATATTLDVDQVLFGSKASAEAAKKKRQHYSKYFGYIDPEEEGFKPPPYGVGYKAAEEMVPLNAPAEIGMTYDLDSKDGIHVAEVRPGGPAAQAGLRAGDVIVQTGKFARRDGKEPKAYAVENPSHLEFVLKMADPQYAIPFRVVRGDADFYLPIQPIEKQRAGEGSTMHIPAAEIQAATGQAPQPPVEPEPTTPQAYPAKRPSRAKQMFLGLRGTKRPTAQRRLPLRYPPNEPTPSRETGNPPANVSSLT